MPCSVVFPTTEDVQRVSHSTVFRESNQFWNIGHWNNSERLGHVAMLIKSAQSEWEASGGAGFMPLFVWIDYYFARELPAEALYEYSQEFKVAYPDDISSYDAWVGVYTRVLIQTYIGAKAEYEAVAFLSTQFPGMTVSLTGDCLDRLFCVDIEVFDNGRRRYAFQLKPQSFLIGVRQKKDWAEQAMQYNRKGHEAYNKQYGIKPKFLFWTYQEDSYDFVSEKKALKILAS